MHPDQVDVTVEVVATLVADQFPRWRGLRVRPVVSHGTVNALFRLGEDVVLRFPLRPSAEPWLRETLRGIHDNVRHIAVHVPLAVPEPLALGEPGENYPGVWSAYRWLPGEPASSRIVDDFDAFAADLAGFVTALHALDTGGQAWDGVSRGGPLRTLDDEVRQALAASTHLTDTVRLAWLWQDCLQVPAWQGSDVRLHADLMPGNLLVHDGKLTAVIDWEMACFGDPAVDLMPAWNFLPSGARQTYRRILGVDEATWERGRGWAIAQAIIALPYYVDTNPVMAGIARHTINAVLE